MSGTLNMHVLGHPGVVFCAFLAVPIIYPSCSLYFLFTCLYYLFYMLCSTLEDDCVFVMSYIPDLSTQKVKCNFKNGCYFSADSADQCTTLFVMSWHSKVE